ncbi:MAG: CHAD domain-containing protein, partial [Dietzia sp.]
WREWEAEIVDPSRPDARAHLAAVAAACTDAGATTSSSSSKLARAIGPLPDAGAEGVSPVRDALSRDLDKLLDHDPAARRTTMTGVHQMRVAVRGLRSTISTYAAELEARTSDSDLDLPALLAELKVLAAVLGKLRDIQVVDERLATLAAGYPEDVVSPPTRRRLRTELDAEARRAGDRVTAALLSDRYLDLVDRLHDLVRVAGTGPSADSDESTTGGKAQRREAEELLLRGVDRQFERFTKVRTRTERDLAELDLTLAEREELTHVVRKRAKALRRNVSALSETDELRVTPLRDACQRLHTVLGDVQDSVTARQWLRRIARRAETAGESTFGFGVLFEHERGFSERALDGFEGDAAAVTAAYRELSESRRSARKRRKKKDKKAKKGKK